MEHMQTESAPKKTTLARRAGKALVWFFAAMLILTYASRAIGEKLRARVEIGYIKSAALDESTEGTGEWKAGETLLYTAYYTRRVTKVYVRPGGVVEEGDALFAYDVATVKGGKSTNDKKVRVAKRAVEIAEAAVAEADDPVAAESVAESARQALSYAEFTYAQTRALQTGGVVRAPFSGLIVKYDFVPGKPTKAGETGIEIAPEGLTFTLKATSKEAERIELGDAVTLFDGERAEGETLTVARIDAPDAEGTVTVVCAGMGENARMMNGKQDYKIEKQSARYALCVPIGALRQSGPDEYYVLIVTERETILGTELAVRKEGVELLARDERVAAVEGNLSGQDRLVVSSSKELQSGDLVVIPDA